MDTQTLLSNSSVAAFVGAFSAFVLVVANDWRRRRRRKRLLTSLIDENQTLARRKLETLNSFIEALTQNTTAEPVVMRFHTASLQMNYHEVIDMLDANESQAIAALIYWMEAIDGIIDDARRTSIQLRRLVDNDAPNADRSALGGRLLEHYQDAARNLEHLIDLCGHYVSGNPHLIVEFRHPN